MHFPRLSVGFRSIPLFAAGAAILTACNCLTAQNSPPTTPRATAWSAALFPTTGDTVSWGAGCALCDERFENGVRIRFVASAGHDTLVVAVAVYSNPDYTLLGLQLANPSKHRVLFDPNAMRLAVRRREKDPWNTYRPWTRSELVDQAADKFKDERFSQRLQEVLKTLSGAVQTTQTSATVLGSGGAVTGRAISTTRRPADVSANEARIADANEREATMRASVPLFFLAQQTLDPGMEVSGLVAFERQKSADLFVLMLPIAQTHFGFGLVPDP